MSISSINVLSFVIVLLVSISFKVKNIIYPKREERHNLKKAVVEGCMYLSINERDAPPSYYLSPSFLLMLQKKEYKHIQKKEKDWFRLKGYVHLGPQHTLADRKRIEPYVKDKLSVNKHAFLPFIHKELKVRKFRREVAHDGTRSILRKPSSKTRHIYYSNHLDAKVFSYYSELLSKEYEKLLKEYNISDCITAYRSVNVNESNKNSPNKSTVHFANDVFQFIKSSKSEDLVAITFDIKGFFDNLNHKHLKRMWRQVMGYESSLPDDHYNVYRNITKFSYIEENDLFEMFKDRIIARKPLKGNKKGKEKKIKIDRIKYFRNKGAVSYCDFKDLKEIRDKGLIKSNKFFYDKKYHTKSRLRDIGIPQGSTISAMLANIYMLEFDIDANKLADNLGGIYKRYSDDMVIVCPIEYEEMIFDHFKTSIRQAKLEIQDDKTQIFNFIYDAVEERYYCNEKNINTGKLVLNKNFEYLGFQFDGYYTMIRNASLSNYYRKMKKRFARSAFYTYHNKTKTNGEIFKEGLYKSYTYKGSHRRKIYKKHLNNKNTYDVIKKHDWGNFITYANLASKVIPDNKIKSQTKLFWGNFHKQMERIERK